MRSKVINLKLYNRVNRRGGTSPFLVGIELNPGPKRKACRKTAKEPKTRKKYKQLDDYQKGKIAMGLDIGLSRGEIQRDLGIGKNATQTWADRYERDGEMKRKKGSGRPRVTTEAEDRYLKVQCKRNRKSTAVELAKTIKKNGKPKATVRTIRNRLLEIGYPARIARKKPLLTKVQMKKRLQWARDHKDWTIQRWTKVLWSDESFFTLFPHTGRQYVRRQPGEAMREDCLAKTVKHGGGKIMVWGSFHASGTGILKRITGTMDKNKYHTILTRTVIPEIKKLNAQEINDVIWTFQQDNDPKHTAKKNKKYLENKLKEEEVKFEVLPWPSQSPDLNPIEHVWNKLKNALRDRPERPSSLDQLFEFVKEEWEKLPKDYLRVLVESLPRRIEAVIENRGGSIPY
jgi:transposase